VIEEVRVFAMKTREKLGRVTVVVYGSYAKGDFNLWSDVDILLISEAFKNMRFLDRYDLFKDEEKPGFEVKPFTPEEFKKLMSSVSWVEALRNRVVLVDDYEFFH